MSAKRHLIVTAGGTGGHMVPAHVLSGEMMKRGWSVSLITDARGMKYPGLFEGVPKHTIPSASLGGKNPFKWLSSLRQILAGRSASYTLCRKEKPAAMVGFGGYPTLPAILGAIKSRVPTVVHEQNAVLGRVNRLLARRVAAVATAYTNVRRLDTTPTLVGNPVRGDILALRGTPVPAGVHLLVIGGSQGASILSRVVPAAAALLPAALRADLTVTQQCRPEDIEEARAAYAGIGVAANLSTYIEDMAGALGRASLVIARAGASTIAELTAAGRPAIFVPLPTAMDNHQVVNTEEMVAAGGAVMLLQSAFTPEAVAREIEALVPRLPEAAAQAAGAGRPDAGTRLADLVERLAA